MVNATILCEGQKPLRVFSDGLSETMTHGEFVNWVAIFSELCDVDIPTSATYFRKFYKKRFGHDYKHEDLR